MDVVLIVAEGVADAYLHGFLVAAASKIPIKESRQGILE